MKIRIDKNSSLPLHYQLYKQLSQAIYDGELPVGSKMPTEEELCEQYHISRTVARQAYTTLINEGLCVRNRGKGTFVRIPEVADSLVSTTFNFTEEMQRKGFTPKTEELLLEIIDYDEDIYAKMRLSSEEKVWHLERVRYVNGTPFIHMDNYIPYDLFQDLDKYNFNRTSLYSCFENDYDTQVVRTKRVITATNASKREAELLCCEQMTALIRIENTGYSETNKIIDYCIETCEGQKHPLEFEIVKKR